MGNSNQRLSITPDFLTSYLPLLNPSSHTMAKDKLEKREKKEKQTEDVADVDMADAEVRPSL